MDEGKSFTWISALAVIFAIAAVVYISKEFITTLLLSALFAYLLLPVYTRLLLITKKEKLSSLLSISLVALTTIAFLFGVISALATEVSNLQLSQDALYSAIDYSFNRITSFVEGYFPGLIAQYSEQLGQLPSNTARWLVPKVLPFAKSIGSGVAQSLPILLAQFGVALLLTYYLLIDGKSCMDKICDLLPEKELVSIFTAEVDSIYYSLFNVYFITCLLTGIIAAAGFLAFGVSYPLLWGMIVFIFSLIPLIGAGTVYLPMSLYYLLTADYTRCIAILVFGAIFLNVLPENIIRPRLAMRGAAIHPAITLLAFAAPIFVVGKIGVIVGPALYGFVLAAYRTKLRLMEKKSSDSEGIEISKTPDSRENEEEMA
jgi:predicted PurR-regulated permease PerM